MAALLPRTLALLSPTTISPSRTAVRIPQLGASEWSAPTQWARRLCTLSNPESSGTCGVERPVEVVAGDGAKEGGEAPAKKENSETHLDTRTIKIMTYNVWSRDFKEDFRMSALGDLIQRHNPDLICLQEVTPVMYRSLEYHCASWKEYECSLSHEVARERPYYCLQMSKLPVNSFDHIPFPKSKRGRGLYVTDVNIVDGINLVLATTHLESRCCMRRRRDKPSKKEREAERLKNEKRAAQAEESMRILRDLRNVIFCGDMNWNDEVDGSFPLPDGWIDAWNVLKPGENGWTYDTKANAMIAAGSPYLELQERLDRFLCKLVDFKIDSIEMIGKEAIPVISQDIPRNDNFEMIGPRYKLDKLELEMLRRYPVLPSDHFGLVLSITLQAGSISE